ncbi:MAG: transglutaminase domain-containing protein, partial [Candidatus Bathyarchaeota archaeon]|nr:transglutaminase domain-containing protein [Candidatus Bathyarchaeota archaeon]
MALLVISLLLLSTALLSEAIDSIGTIPNLNLRKEKKKPEGIDEHPSCNIEGKCEVEGFMNDTEKIAILGIHGVPGTRYLRAVIFEKYSDGAWTVPEYPLKPYQGEYMPPWVHSYNNEMDRAIEVTPFVNISGYIPTVLNLEKLDSEATLEYNTDLRVFFSEIPFTSEYSLSYKVYFYETEMLVRAQVVDDPKNLEIPVKIADKIAQVAEEAAGNAETPYGKVMSIISYLQESYTYDPDYPRAPKGVDPVLWFLTASKSGVCTQFNSALVLLARSVGVPARLVGGFLINSEMEAQLVYQDQRHAYAEIPFKELGWIIFDATPSAGCSQCESLEKREEDKGERVDTCEPVDSIFNQSECKDCVNNCTKMSPEGGPGQDVDLFEIFGITGTNYLRTTVGEQYNGLWSMSQPDPQQYSGEIISYDVSGFIGDPSHTFMVSPLTDMGGFIPTTLYTNELRLESTIQRYPDQQIFFSLDIFKEPYTLSYTNYEFADATLQSATPLRDPRYMNVPGDRVERLR